MSILRSICPSLLTNARGTYGKQIADHIIGMIIAFNHNLLCYNDQMKTSEPLFVQTLGEHCHRRLGDIGTHWRYGRKPMG